MTDEALQRELLRVTREIEQDGDHLGVFKELYRAAIQAVAQSLRRRFESGELRGWKDEDGEIANSKRPPSWRLEDECQRRWVSSPLRALAILESSPNAHEGGVWDWRDARVSLCAAASETMALDVLAYARARGWTKRQRGEQAAKLLRRAA